jgi:hypothetical protein
MKEVARRERQQELVAKTADSPTPELSSASESDAEEDSAQAASGRQETSAHSAVAQPTKKAGSGPSVRGSGAAGTSSDDTYTNVDGIQVRRPDTGTQIGTEQHRTGGRYGPVSGRLIQF